MSDAAWVEFGRAVTSIVNNLIDHSAVLIPIVITALLTLRNGWKTDKVAAELAANTAITKATQDSVLVNEETKPKPVVVVNSEPIEVVETEPLIPPGD